MSNQDAFLNHKNWFLDVDVKGPAVVTALIGQGPWQLQGTLTREDPDGRWGQDVNVRFESAEIGNGLFVPAGVLLFSEPNPKAGSEGEIVGWVSGYRLNQREGA